MSESYLKLLSGNKKFVAEMTAKDPDFFKNLAKGQSPEFLWIGCSDSRVPANEITDTQPGDIFVHRNIANLVINTDINLLSVLHYSVKYLKVKHIIVCGHYKCGGVLAAMSNNRFGFLDNWLSQIKDVYVAHEEELLKIEDEEARQRRLVELNVIDQVKNLSKISIIQETWEKEKFPILHGWVYDVADGIIKNLDVTMKDNSQIEEVYKFQF